MMTTGSLRFPPARRISCASWSMLVNQIGALLIVYWPCALTTTEISFGRSGCFSASAVGRLICSSVYFEYVVVIIRKMRITSMTSIIGTRLISGSSRCLPRRKFIGRGGAASVRGRRRRRSREVGAIAVHDVDEARGFLFHPHDESVHLVAEMAVEDQRRDRDRDAESRVVQRDRDAARELLRVRPRRTLRAEDLDHADDRAEEPEQRRRGRDRPKRRQ